MTPTTRTSGEPTSGGPGPALSPAPTLDPAVEAGVPRRLLVVSATVGDGHDAAAAAVEERAGVLWPACRIRRVDTLDTMGRAFRWTYRANIDHAPWLYDYAYRELWRRPRFASAARRAASAWAGRTLGPVVAEFRPDLVVSTYPLGTGGLDWLRRRGRLEVPLAAMVSDFAPHPLWVYPEVDLHYVASELSLRALVRARPDARGSVGAPPVLSAFRTADRASARAALGLPASRPVVLVSLGPRGAGTRGRRGTDGLGSGPVDRAVDAALAAAATTCVVVTCGRDEALRQRLAAREEPSDRLVPLAGTDRLPELTAAADAVVTDAGGATALEALATGRAVLLFEPVPGHGKANAALMEQAGLGWVCPDQDALERTLRSLVRTPDVLAAAERRAAEHTQSLDFDAEVAGLPELRRHQGSRPLSAADALFVGAATAEVPQQVGTLAMLAPLDPGDAAEVLDPVEALDPQRIAAGLRRRFTERADRLPMLRRRLWLAPRRRPRWLVDDEVDPARHIRARSLADARGRSWDDAVREFFDTPVPSDRPPWELQVLADPGTARTAVLAKLHHSLGDSSAVTATLSELLSDTPAPNLLAVSTADRPEPEQMPRVGRLARGLLGLATAGRAAVGAPRPSGPRRRYARAELPAGQVRAVARELRAGSTAVLLGVLGEALYRFGAPVTTTNDRLRTAVPVTPRRVRLAEAAGNDTAAVMLDLPVGAMSTRERIVAVADELARLDRQGQSAAARFAVLALGRLPAGTQSRLARVVYGGRFFSLIASVMPGRRRELRMLGTRLTSVYPVLPLADGVGLAVGFLGWGDVLGVGVTADGALFPDAEDFAATITRVFGELVAP